MELNDTQKAIQEVCSVMADFLVEKNQKYGNSAIEPLCIFSKGLSNSESILVRCDDKISRIKNSSEIRKNDIMDLLGYLVLFCVAKKWTKYQDISE